MYSIYKGITGVSPLAEEASGWARDGGPGLRWSRHPVIGTTFDCLTSGPPFL